MNASECGAQGLGSDSSTIQQHSAPSVIIYVYGDFCLFFFVSYVTEQLQQFFCKL